MQDIWARIDSWLQVNAPTVLDTLHPGATEAQISELEAELSIQLPEDVKWLYRIHDGQLPEYGLLYGREWLSLWRIKDEWQVWKDLLDDGTFENDDGQDQSCAPDPGVRNVWWSPKWIPLTHDGGGNHDCLDLDPVEGGTVGQMITMWHDSAEREIMAPSFRSWLEDFAEGLESGQFVYSEDYSGIVDVDDL